LRGFSTFVTEVQILLKMSEKWLEMADFAATVAASGG
jgi:hypothetical protein